MLVFVDLFTFNHTTCFQCLRAIQIKSNNLNVNLLHRLKCSILATLKQNQNVSNIFNVNEIQFQCVLLKSKVNQVTNYSNAILYYIQV